VHESACNFQERPACHSATVAGCQHTTCRLTCAGGAALQYHWASTAVTALSGRQQLCMDSADSCWCATLAVLLARLLALRSRTAGKCWAADTHSAQASKHMVARQRLLSAMNPVTLQAGLAFPAACSAAVWRTHCCLCGPFHCFLWSAPGENVWCLTLWVFVLILILCVSVCRHTG
jgi:hypothetical protein